MFAGLQLNISFPFGRQQQTITITTRGITDIQYAPTPQYHNQPPYSSESGPSGGRKGHLVEPLRSAPTRPQKASDSGNQGPGKEQNKLRKTTQKQPAAPEAYGQAPPQPNQGPQQETGPPGLGAPVQPPAPKQKLPHIGPRIFHYSRCTGKKKAVCVGINYTGSSKALKGCVNDARSIRAFLIKSWNFKSEDVMILTDDNKDPKRLPTKANILDAMKWLVKDAKAHDSLFFHYSGHGGQIRSTSGDETEGYDDVIFPLDYEQKGVGIITDNVMNELLVRTIPDGCRLTALFDSCHSGSILDLVYLYHTNGLLKSSPVSEKYRAMKSSPGDVICFSGCEDTQTSTDTVEGGLAVGAMSWAFVQCLSANPKQSYQDLLKNVRQLLRKHFSQRPQLSTSHRIDIRKGFIL